jgi:dienelactone hydrolase
LASHGFVVVAPDHTGNSFADLVARSRRDTTLTPQQREILIERIIADRVPDLRFVVDALRSVTDLTEGVGVIDIADVIDWERMGLVGWSFGGWAALATPEVDNRFSAVVAIAPGGSANPLPGIIPAQLSFKWQLEVPTLFLVAEFDRYTPLSGMAELYERTPSRKQMFVLRYADHDHFGDHVETELCPRFAAHLFTRALALAHLEAALKSNTAAEAFLASDPIAHLQARGVAALAYPTAH